MTPKILFRLPFNGGKLTTAAVHSILFAVVFYLTAGLISKTQEGLCQYTTKVNKKGNFLDLKNAEVNKKLDNSGAAPAWKGKWTCKNDTKCSEKPCWVNDDKKDRNTYVTKLANTSPGASMNLT
jgi:hypothetical protein